MLCSMRGTETARVDGLWLVSRPNHSVSEDPDDSPEISVCSPFIVPSQNSIRNPCDSISWCHNHLLWSSSGKTTVHMHWKHCSSSVHLLAYMPEFLITINASEPLCLFLNLNSVPVTLSPRNFVCPHTGVLIYLHTFNKTQADITNKDDGCNILTKILKKHKTWWVNAQLTDNLKYLHAKHTIHKGRKHKPSKCTNMTNCHGASSPFTFK